MASIQIPNLPAVVGLDGSELFEGVQAGTSVKISLNQMIAAARGGTPATLPIPVSLGGTGVTTLTGYVKGSGTSPFTASPTIPNTDITGLGTMSTQNADAVAITGGTAALTGASSVTANSASAAFTVTQTGAGASILVEDSASPDSSPFIVDATGTVGIGTLTPTSNLHIYNANASISMNEVAAAGTGVASTRWKYSTNQFGLYVGATNALVTYDYGAAAERMRIDASGNMGIGTTSIVAVYGKTLQIGDGTTTSSISLIGTGAGTTGDVFLASTGSEASLTARASTPLILGAGGSERFRIGDLGQWGIGGANYGTSGQTIISAGAAAAPAWGAIGVAGGGTGIISYAIGDLVYASGATTLSKLADVATGNALISGGVGVAPSYGKIGLTTHVSGTLPVANGGTNITSYAVGDILYASATGVLSSLADVATGNALISGGVGVSPSYGKIGLTTHVSGTLAVGNGGTGATTLTGYVKGTGTTAMTASATIPNTDISGLGTMSTQAASAVAITGGTINGTTVGATTASTGAFTTVTASTSVLSTGAGGIGYATGAGVAVTQLTSRTTTTPTTGAKTTGAVTLFTTTAVVGTYFSFTVPNTAIAVTDTVVLSVRGATNTYVASVTAITAATSFQVTMASVVGIASDTPIVNFTIIKGVSA